MSSPHTPYRNISTWNFAVEPTDVILRHNVQCRGSVSRLPILVLECSKRSQLRRVAHTRGFKFGFLKTQRLMKLLEIFWGQSCPPPFLMRCTLRALWRCALTAPNLYIWGEGFLGLVKLQKGSDRVTCYINNEDANNSP